MQRAFIYDVDGVPGIAGVRQPGESYRKLRRMQRIKLILKYLLAAFFVLAGLNHFIKPDFYLKIMPPYLPWHLLLVYLSGVVEIVLGLLLLLPKFTRAAAWGLIALLVAVFPANIHMAFNQELTRSITPRPCG